MLRNFVYFAVFFIFSLWPTQWTCGGEAADGWRGVGLFRWCLRSCIWLVGFQGHLLLLVHNWVGIFSDHPACLAWYILCFLDSTRQIKGGLRSKSSLWGVGSISPTWHHQNSLQWASCCLCVRPIPPTGHDIRASMRAIPEKVNWENGSATVL